tara:strand:- start:365 stop:640 length:276 start_codon:yes stop_codon:yes gene_type:complete
MQHIKLAIKSFLNKSGLKEGIEEQKAIKIWDKIVGPKISNNTEPISIKNGVIIIKTNNSVWRQELQFQKQKIIKKLNQKLKKKIIREIIFK